MSTTTGSGAIGSGTSGSSQSGGGGDLRNELKGDANKLKDTAEHQAENKAQEGKEQVAKTASSASSAMNAAAQKLRDDPNAPSWMGSSVSSAAEQIEDFASRLQDKSPREIAREASRFGRENPAAFLGLSAAVGFAAARFLRAGAEYRSDHDSETDFGSGGGTGNYGNAGMGSAGGSTSTMPVSPTTTTSPSTASTGRTTLAGNPGETL